jgi:hypothetical protein
MLLRVVRVTVAPGKHGEYWSWAKEIVELWDSAGVRRAGGPFSSAGPAGEDIANWLTFHESEDQAREEFRALYSTVRGAELIARRPPLVSDTVTVTFPAWDGAGPPPLPPVF